MTTSDSLISVYAGKLGSGKTWAAVLRAMDALMSGQVLVTNIILIWPAVEAYCRSRGVKHIPRENYRYFSTEAVKEDVDILLRLLTHNSLLVFDEVHLVLDSRDWRENAQRSSGLQLLTTQARKVDVDMIFISQSETRIDSRILAMATYIVRVQNWLHLPVFGTLLPFPVTIAKTCAPDGRTVYAKEWIWRRGNVARLYDSKQTHRDLKLSGAPAKRVIGAKRRRLGYGWILMMVGAGALVMDRVLRSEVEKPALVQVGKSKVETPAPVAAPAGPAASVESSSPAFSAGVVAAFEMSLPPIYRVVPRRITCVNGLTIRPGSVLGLGVVTSWKVGGQFVTVQTSSPVMPQIRLFYGSKPFLCDDDGRSLRDGDGSAVRTVPGGVAEVSGVGAVEQAGQWSAPEPFIAPAWSPLYGAPLGDRLGRRIGQKPR